MLTLEELKERLENVDEVTLMETLELDSKMIVDKFEDHIIDNFDKLLELL
tara:strand:+ start:1116 stop:1265 length:150 start_codon:yes stop_codon:yes gene_type:complete